MKKINLLSTVAVVSLLMASFGAPAFAQQAPTAAPVVDEDHEALPPGEDAYLHTFEKYYEQWKLLADPGQAEEFKRIWEHKFAATGELKTEAGAQQAIDLLTKAGSLVGCPERPDYKCLYVRALRTYMHMQFNQSDSGVNLADANQQAKWVAEWLHKFDNNPAIFTTEAGAISAIRQMRNSLGQRFNFVYAPQDTAFEKRSMEAQYIGIDLPVSMNNSNKVLIGRQLELFLHEPDETSPAFGLVHYRDVIVKIEGRSVEKMTLEEVLQSFIGPVNSHLKITVRRGEHFPDLHFVDLDLTRGYIVDPLSTQPPQGAAEIGVSMEVKHLDEVKFGPGFELIADNPREGSPAQGKIEQGDMIVAIDHVSINGKTMAQLVEEIYGPVDSTVVLTVRRHGKERDITITRAVVEDHVVHFQDLGDGISLTRLDNFVAENVDTQISTAIARSLLPIASKALKTKGDAQSMARAARFDALLNELTGGKQIDAATLATVIQARYVYDELAAGQGGFILDMTGNPGGDKEKLLTVLGMLLPQGETVAIAERQPGTDRISIKESFLMPGFAIETEHPLGARLNQTQVHVGPRVPLLLPSTMPFKVLIDSDCASACETVAGALQVNHRAELIGTSSHGKDEGQTIVVLPYYVSVHVTSLMFRPGGVDSNGKGLTPDIEVIASNNGSFFDAARDRAVAEIKKDNANMINRARAGQVSLEKRSVLYDRLMKQRRIEAAKPIADQDPSRLD